MPNTPGFVIPSSYSSNAELEDDLHRRDVAAGFTLFDPSDFGGDDSIEHSGVKGMKWGVHHTTDENAHPNYSRKDRAVDHSTVGRRGVNRINASMHEGKSLSEARKMEARHQFKKAAIILGASVAVHVMNEHGDAIMKNINGTIYEQALRNRGQAAADRIMQDRMISQNPHPFSYAKSNRKGVHKITSL